MWWWNFSVPAVMGGAYLWKILARRHRRLRLWRAALAPSQAEDVEVSALWSWQPTIMFRAGPLTVWITSATASEDRVKVVIEGAEGFSVLKLRRQFLKRKGEIELGDKKFDDEFIVEGPVRPVAALLDATLRGQLLHADAGCRSLEIGDGGLRAEVDDTTLSHVLFNLLKIGRKLAEPLDVDPQIAQNARQDPEAGVRLFNLLLLIREHPGDPDVLKVLRAACSDESPRVQVRAAIELGEEARDDLLKLVKRTKDDEASALAISHLGGELPFKNARYVLFRSLGKDFVQTPLACLKVLGQRRAEAVDTLAQVLTEQKGELAVAAAAALGETGADAAEAPLLKALQNEESDIREAAAAALGRVGSVAAVQPLQEAAERFWLDLGLRREARQAIAEIQSRLEGASPGQLSLAEAEAGQLSLAQAEAGQLSLTQAELPMLPHASDDAEQQPPSRTRETPADRRA